MKTNPFVNRSWVASGLYCLVVAVAGFQTLSPSRVPAGRPAPAGVIAQELRGFNVVAGVLYIAAHPDDENTQLLAFLARGRQYRTAYLSMTRGDGGQNVLGSEFGQEPGVIRTEELLVATPKTRSKPPGSGTACRCFPTSYGSSVPFAPTS